MHSSQEQSDHRLNQQRMGSCPGKTALGNGHQGTSSREVPLQDQSVNYMLIRSHDDKPRLRKHPSCGDWQLRLTITQRINGIQQLIQGTREGHIFISTQKLLICFLPSAKEKNKNNPLSSAQPKCMTNPFILLW